MAAAHQAGGPALYGHDGNHPVPQPETGWQVALVRIRARTEIGNHAAFRRTNAARLGLLRDHRSGMVRWGLRATRGSIHRRRPDLEGRAASRSHRSQGAYPIQDGLELEWNRSRSSV